MNTRIRIVAIVLVVLLLGGGAYYFMTAGRESTEDAQVDAHVTPIAALVGGTVAKVSVADNQQVEAGTELLVIDPRDYEIALARAQASLADATAQAAAAQATGVITSTTATSHVSTAKGGVTQAESGVLEAEHGVAVAQARLQTAQARLKEQQANATKTTRDVERLKGLLAKDEIAQQQYDAVVAGADAATAAVESARAQVSEAEASSKAAESRIATAWQLSSQSNSTAFAARANRARAAGARRQPQTMAAPMSRGNSAAGKMSAVAKGLRLSKASIQTFKEWGDHKISHHAYRASHPSCVSQGHYLGRWLLLVRRGRLCAHEGHHRRRIGLCQRPH